MKEFAFNTPIIRNRDFRATVKERKLNLINMAKRLNGQTAQGAFDYYWRWTSADRKYKVGVGKFGKEYYLATIRWKDGHLANNPNDMRPVICVNGKIKDFDSSFDHVFRFFQHVRDNDKQALRILGCLVIRNAYLEDHDENMIYCPPQEALYYLDTHVPEFDGVSIEAYLQYMEMVAWNEDVKYDTLGYDIHSGTGRTNNMLTYAHVISVLQGTSPLSKLCSSFARQPVGVAPIPLNIARQAFPELKIR